MDSFEWRFDWAFDWQDGWTPLFVHLASLAYVVAFLVRDQISLRLLVLLGVVLELAYFYWIAEKPLWDAILWSVIFAAANIFTLWRILREGQLGTLSDEDLRLHAAMPGIAPADFRKLLSLSERRRARDREHLTREDAEVDALYFVLDDGLTMHKAGREQTLKSGIFIGEIAFVLDRPASATVTAEPGTRYLRWPASALHDLIKKTDSLKSSLEAALTRDLAAKVAESR